MVFIITGTKARNGYSKSNFYNLKEQSVFVFIFKIISPNVINFMEIIGINFGNLMSVKMLMCVLHFVYWTAQVTSVQLLSHVRLFVTHGSQHARPPCPTSTPRVYSNSCYLSWWCHPAISSSVIPFSSGLKSFPASGLFQRGSC